MNHRSAWEILNERTRPRQQHTSQATNYLHAETKRGIAGTNRVLRTAHDKTLSHDRAHTHVQKSHKRRLYQPTLARNHGRGFFAPHRPISEDPTPYVKLALHEADSVIHVSRDACHCSPAFFPPPRLSRLRRAVDRACADTEAEWSQFRGLQFRPLAHAHCNALLPRCAATRQGQHG